MKLKQYPKYKDSGVQWIGEIPDEWKIYKLKFLLSSLQSGKRESDETAPVEEGAFSLGGEHVNWNGTLNLDHVRLLSDEYYNSMNNGKIKKNDVLLVKDGATIGKTAIVNEMIYEKMAVNEHVFLMRPNNKINSKLLYYMICSDSGFTQIKLTETGSAQGGINTTFTNNVLYAIPEDKSEIKPIISFLDSKTYQLDQTISKDKQLIELLKEKRTALINHVVTKGLDKNAKMKDCGVEWIGEIPEGWEVRKFSHFINLITKGATPTSYGFEFELEGINFLKVESIDDKGNFLKNKMQYISEECDNFLARSKIKKEDFLFSIAGALGRVAVANENILPANTNQALAIIRLNRRKVTPEYMFYNMQADYVKTSISLMAVESAQANLSMDNIKMFKIILPDKKEQQQIVEYLDKETSKIDQIIKKIEEKITLMEEYKKSLIHHVVTGKVYVREAVA